MFDIVLVIYKLKTSKPHPVIIQAKSYALAYSFIK